MDATNLDILDLVQEEDSSVLLTAIFSACKKIWLSCLLN